MKKILILMFVLYIMLYPPFSINALALSIEALSTPTNPIKLLISPIDGGLIVLIAIGMVYSASIIKTKFKQYNYSLFVN